MISGVCVRRLGLLSAATHRYAGLGSKCPLLARANVHHTMATKTHPTRIEGSRAGPNCRRTPRIAGCNSGDCEGITLAPPLAVSAAIALSK